MLKEFENSLDNLLAQYGLEKTGADTTGLTPGVQDQFRHSIPDDARASKTRQPSTDIGAIPSKADFGVGSGIGRAEEMTFTPALRAVVDIKTAMAVVTDIAKAKALQKLGFRNIEHRFYAFGPTDKLNTERVLGFYEAALKSKYASTLPSERKSKLASDKLVKELLKLAALGATTAKAVGSMLDSVMSHKLETAAVTAGLGGPLLAKAMKASGTYDPVHNNPMLTRNHFSYAGDGRSGLLGL